MNLVSVYNIQGNYDGDDENNDNDGVNNDNDDEEEDDNDDYNDENHNSIAKTTGQKHSLYESF